jgi:hypothetical protein
MTDTHTDDLTDQIAATLCNARPGHAWDHAGPTERDENRLLARALLADGTLADRLAAADTLLDALTDLVDAVERGDHALPPALNRARLLLGNAR